MASRFHSVGAYILPILFVVAGAAHMAREAHASSNPMCKVASVVQVVPNPDYDPNDPQSPPTITQVSWTCLQLNCSHGCMQLGAPPPNPTAGQSGSVNCVCGPRIPPLCRIGITWFAEPDGQGGVGITWLHLGLCTQQGCPAGTACDTVSVPVPNGGATYCDCK